MANQQNSETQSSHSAEFSQSNSNNKPQDQSGSGKIPYRPPGLLKRQFENDDNSLPDPQRTAWESLRKNINALINKANTSNIQTIVIELLELNLLWGKGLLIKTLMKAQFASPSFTAIYACIAAVLNSKLPQIGELLLKRVIIQFRKSYRRNDKSLCLASVTFLAQLVNFRVASPLLALELAVLFLENPTDDSVQIAVNFIKECGQALQRDCPKTSECIYARFRELLIQENLQNQTQFLIESLFAVRKAKFQEYPAMPKELDLIEDDDFVTHLVELDAELDTEERLNFFQPSETYAKDCEEWTEIQQEILGETSEESSEEEGEQGKQAESNDSTSTANNNQIQIQDKTAEILTKLRKSVYLTIMASVDFEETVHRILKLTIPEGLHIEVCNMIVECCAQEKAFQRHYGLIAERLCKLNSILWSTCYEKSFGHFYKQIHRYDVNQIRNIALLFGHLLETNSLAWSVFDFVQLNEAETTSSSRIFLKIIFQDLNEFLGSKVLKERLFAPQWQSYFGGLFPKDDASKVRFCINFFTAIGLGYLTEEMRKILPTLSSG